MEWTKSSSENVLLMVGLKNMDIKDRGLRFHTILLLIEKIRPTLLDISGTIRRAAPSTGSMFLGQNKLEMADDRGGLHLQGQFSIGMPTSL